MQPALTLTRRSLLRAGAIATAASFVGLRPWAAAPAAAASGHLLRSSYDGLVGEGFRVGSADLRLLSVGVPRRPFRAYGTPEDLDLIAGLDPAAIEARIGAFLDRR